MGGKEDDNQTESEEDRKPTQKKRKPTQKQIEEAELAAKPRYSEAHRPGPCDSSSAFCILNWNVASLASTLKKEPLAISALAEKENAQLICLQVSAAVVKFHGSAEAGIRAASVCDYFIASTRLTRKLKAWRHRVCTALL